MDQPFLIEFIGGTLSVDLPPTAVLALVVLIIASWVRRQALSGKGNWVKAWEAIGPSLRESPAPMVTASRGVTGCLTWLLGWLFWPLLLGISIDLLLFRGDSMVYIWQNLGVWLLAIGHFLRDLLRQIASAML